MIVIAYEKTSKIKLLGGLGDRIVGLIACKLIAKLLKQDFYIIWNKENIKKYIDYNNYDFEQLDISLNDVKCYNYIDLGNNLINYLSNSENLFTNNINKFYLNMEISQFLFLNKMFNHLNYYDHILNEYKLLYTDILKPTKFLYEKINNIITNNKYIIGIQIRTGDKFMISNKTDHNGNNHEKSFAYPEFRNIKTIDQYIQTILMRIKNHINSSNIIDYKIFITSDYTDIYNTSIKVWSIEQIIYNNDVIQHLDRTPVDTNISKVFIDNYILSQKTNMLYISTHSNYGRIAALSCNHNKIYDLHRKNVDIKKLLINK